MHDLVLPDTLLRVSGRKDLGPMLRGWPAYKENDKAYWMFEQPPGLSDTSARRVQWRTAQLDGLSPRNVVAHLVRRYLERQCRIRGLAEWRDEKKRSRLFFPVDDRTKNRLSFVGYDGRKSWVKTSGVRSFRTVRGPEKSRYHLCPEFSPEIDSMGHAAVIVRIRLHLTDLNGNVLTNLVALRRRKGICKNWWNYEWLGRVLASAQWLTAGNDLNLAAGPECEIIVRSAPRTMTAPLGIPEDEAPPEIVEAEPEIDDEDVEEEDGGDAS